MDWLRRIRRTSSPEETVPAPIERAAPGIAALFAGLIEDGSHAVLDFGGNHHEIRFENTLLAALTSDQFEFI